MSRAEQNWVVWEWIDPDDGKIFYVGCGTHVYGKHPADVLFSLRESYDSDLNLRLREFDKPPRFDNEQFAEVKMYPRNAKAYVDSRRKSLRERGVKLLSTRPHGTKKGGGSANGVLRPDGVQYPSVRAAAAATGVNASTITRRCQNPKSEWKYVK